MQVGLKKGLIAIFSANVVNLIFNLLSNFLLPKYLSVDSYAAFKTFQLYSTYVGVFSLGFADGMYLRYGGKTLSLVDHRELSVEMSTHRVLLIIESVIFVPIAWFIGDKILFCFSLTILSMNMVSCFKNLYQAVGEFKRYGKILNWSTISGFVIDMILLFVIKTDNYFFYLGATAIKDIIIWGCLEYIAYYHLEIKRPKVLFSLKLLINNVKTGFLLMVGNFSNILLSSMDRWFVKAMMTSKEFAHYSFAVSLEGFLNIAITPITVTMYNYFCNHQSREDVIKTRKLVTIFGTWIIAAAFPAKFIVEHYLQEYLESLQVLFILFATQAIYVVIKGVYINLYKAQKKQNTYFVKLIIVLAIGAILNYMFVKCWNFKEAFSYATLTSSVIWLFISARDFQEYNYSLREILYLALEITGFLICGRMFNSLIGIILYVVLTLLLMATILREESRSLVLMIKNAVRHNV